jgi:hypothetical protein
MKTLIIFNKYVFILFCAILTLLSGCNKENDEGNFYRLINFHEQLLGESDLNCTIIYEGEKISLINYFYDDDDGKDTVKEEYTYPMNDVIVRTKSYAQVGKWLPSWKEEMVFENDRMIRSVSSNYNTNFQNWQESYKVEYLYASGDLVEENSFTIYNGQLTPSDRSIYDYKNGLLFSIMTYNFDQDWKIAESEKIYYNGERASYSMYYYYSNGIISDSSKFEFFYNGEFLNSISLYNYGTHEQKTPFTFGYDSNGNLISEHIEILDLIYQMDYTYEKGKGNYEDLKDPGGGSSVFTFYPYPTKSVPATSVSQAPRLPGLYRSNTHTRNPFQGPTPPNK